MTAYRETSLMCPNCGMINTIQRKNANLRVEGHVKDLNCPGCKSMQKMIEIPDIDKYNYTLKSSDNLLNIKLYSKYVTVSNLKVTLTIGSYKKWSKILSNEIYKKIFDQSDYNIMETLLLNYLNNDDFREKADKLYKLKNKINIKSIQMENVTFSIYTPIYVRISDYCLMENIDISVLLQTLMDMMDESDVKFDFKSK